MSMWSLLRNVRWWDSRKPVRQQVRVEHKWRAKARRHAVKMQARENAEANCGRRRHEKLRTSPKKLRRAMNRKERAEQAERARQKAE